MIPEHCALWKKQTLVAEDLYERFSEVKTFHANHDTSKRLLQCTECGQYYIYEYTGTTDPHDSTLEILYIPVRVLGNMIEADASGVPHMRVDWPKEHEQPTVRWVLN